MITQDAKKFTEAEIIQAYKVSLDETRRQLEEARAALAPVVEHAARGAGL